MSVFRNHVGGLTKCLVVGICKRYTIVIINVTNKCAFAYRICRTQVHFLYSGTVSSRVGLCPHQPDEPSLLCFLFRAVKMDHITLFISLLYFLC